MVRADIVARYLEAVELAPREPDLAFLTKLIRRHVATFAFSSVGVRLGDELPLTLPALFDRIVSRRRGGYCFEQNGLFYEVLEELGFTVDLCLARVIYGQDVHPGLTHRNSLVQLDGRTYVADAGFGADGPRVPVPLSGEETRDGERCYRVVERDEGELHLQLLKEEGFFSLYRFEVTRYGQADCELGHFYSHRHPDAAFVKHLVAMRLLDGEIRSLRDLDYWVFTASETRKQGVRDAAQLGRILTQDFGIQVTDFEVRRLFADLGLIRFRPLQRRGVVRCGKTLRGE